MNTFAEPSSVVALLGFAIPLTLAAVAVVAPARAAPASVAALGMALLFAAGVALGGGGTRFGVGGDGVASVMLVLVAALGAVVVRYSQTYLQGDPSRRLLHYQRWLLLTLAAVTGLVVASNLLVIALAWTATSLALHRLLTFYADRPLARVAAHKKFVVSRLADACLFGCLALVHRAVGSFSLDRIAQAAAAPGNLLVFANGRPPHLPQALELAAVLVVVAVALRSAQLPFHGWLTQVMEAPTPVSALLHAGVVNIGGFVLIRLAPWIGRATVAPALLVAIGLASAVVGALVMTTRISVKVALAWSTCAQMGFMLVQCGLGLWHLALLHLVAHSLYKAHAFLSAGSAVDTWRLRELAHVEQPRPAGTVLVATGFAVLGAAALDRLSAALGAPHDGTTRAVFALLVGLALVPLLGRMTIGSLGRPLGVAALYFAGHTAAARLFPTPAEAHPIALASVGVAFLALFAIKSNFQRFPQGRFAQAAYPWLFAGLYLDEAFTRLAFRVWPPHFAGAAAAPAPIRIETTLEARP